MFGKMFYLVENKSMKERKQKLTLDKEPPDNAPFVPQAEQPGEHKLPIMEHCC